MSEPIITVCCSYPFNQGHFEKGIFVYDCKRCGACCMYEWALIKNEKEYLESEYRVFNEYHGWERVGNVLSLYAPCKMLEKISETQYSCKLHESDRPDCCVRHGYGDYHHPVGCSFFGGDFDKEAYPEVKQ